MKIAFTGAHGVGKTTLLKILVEKLPDYKFELESPTRQAIKDSTKVNFGSTMETQKLITEKNIELIKNAPENYFSPRTLFDVVAYTTYYKKTIKGTNITDEFIDSQLDMLYEHTKDFGRIFYIPPEFEQKESGKYREGQLENPDYQRDIDTIIRFLLWSYGINPIIIKGTVEERIEKILRNIPSKDIK